MYIFIMTRFISPAQGKKHKTKTSTCPSEYHRFLFALQNKSCAFQDVNIQKNCMTLKHLSKSTEVTKDVTKASLCYLSLKFRAPPPLHFEADSEVKLSFTPPSSSSSTNFIRISVVWFTKRGEIQGSTVVCIFLVVQSQCNLGHNFFR